MESSEETPIQESQPTPPEDYVVELVRKARGAATKLAALSTAVKDEALLAMADSLVEKTDHILEANTQDLDALEAEGE